MHPASKTEAISATIMLIGMAVGMLIMVGGGSRIVGSLSAVPNITDNYISRTPLQVCDLLGSVQGLVRNDNLTGERNVTITSIDTSVVASSCHTKNIGDVLRLFDIAATLPKGDAAFGADNVDISVGLYNSLGQQVTARTFTITAERFQIDKPFEEQLGYRSLDTGQTYTYKVFTSWSPDTAVYIKNISI